MKLRIIKWKHVIDHCKNDKMMTKAFERFYEVAQESEWKKPQDILETFNNADLVTCLKSNTSRIIFNIGSNKYRLIVGYFFTITQTIFYIKFVGTHTEYDSIEVCDVDMFKSK